MVLTLEVLYCWITLPFITLPGLLSLFKALVPLCISYIEELFSKVKACLKENDEAIQAADESAIVDFVRAAFSTATPDDCYSWFEHAGYIH